MLLSVRRSQTYNIAKFPLFFVALLYVTFPGTEKSYKTFSFFIGRIYPALLLVVVKAYHIRELPLPVLIHRLAVPRNYGVVAVRDSLGSNAVPVPDAV